MLIVIMEKQSSRRCWQRCGRRYGRHEPDAAARASAVQPSCRPSSLQCRHERTQLSFRQIQVNVVRFARRYTRSLPLGVAGSRQTTVESPAVISDPLLPRRDTLSCPVSIGTLSLSNYVDYLAVENISCAYWR